MLSSFKFHHIGIAVKEIEATSALYVNAGYKKSEDFLDSFQNVKICWLEKEGMPRCELLAPVDEKSPVVKTLEKNGVTPYHTCYEVEKIEEAIAELRKQRYVLVSASHEAPGMMPFGGGKVAFLFHKDAGLIELVEICK
ncbi:VOC family protein [uncultured Treponema sp.]|uniref:VOC family protein n=1 Tax=uncultured Treponema sp. TaxID=162155 RepID=UPI00262E71C4|nr:VOC family protein [uncultured Treponema sp.]